MHWTSGDDRWAWVLGWKIAKDGTFVQRWRIDPVPAIHAAAARGDDFYRRAVAEATRRRLAS